MLMTTLNEDLFCFELSPEIMSLTTNWKKKNNIILDKRGYQVNSFLIF